MAGSQTSGMLRHALLLPLQSFDNISTGAYGETYVATARESLDAPYVALQYSRSFLPVSRLESSGYLQLPAFTPCVTASASRRGWNCRCSAAHWLSHLTLTLCSQKAWQERCTCVVAHISRPAGRLLPCKKD